MTVDIATVLSQVGISPWLAVLVFVLCLVDGFFPPVPSETAVLAALTLAFSSHAGEWVIGGILLAAAAGAAAGDSIAYLLGHKLGTQRWAWMRRPRVQSAMMWAASQLDARPASLILGARYIPIGRVAVNVTAGATGLPYRRFLPLSAVAAVLWAGMCWVLATVVSAWLGDSPILAMVVAVAVSIVLGVLVDLASRGVQNLRARRNTPEVTTTPGRIQD